MAKELTTAALAAQEIRAELKKTFPKMTFRVTSKNYSGGDSVRISWTDGPTTDAVNQVAAKYQYGHFDGMTDGYDYSNRREDIHQARFVFTDREMSKETAARIDAAIVARYGVDISNERECEETFHRTPRSMRYEAFESGLYI